MDLRRNLFLLTILLFCISDSYSQTIIPSDSKYYFNKNLYDFQDMDDVFISNFDSYMEYKKALRARNNTRLFGHMTLSVMTVSTLAIIIDNNTGSCDFICLSTGDVIGLMGWLFVVPITSIVGLITRISYNSKKKKAINLFNAAGDVGQFYIPPSWNVHVGATPNGTGVVINF